MKKIFIYILLSTLSSVNIYGISINEIRFHNSVTDSTNITDILKKAHQVNLSTPNERIGHIARLFIGVPYVAQTLEHTPEMLTINIDELDCTTFVETVIALAYTIGENRTSWQDYAHNLERIRYRNGKLNGYSSRLHYISDWITNNSFRGNVTEVTDRFPEVSYAIKTLDFMTSNRDKYNALTNDTTFILMKGVEIGYHNHRFPFIKSSSLNKKATRKSLKDGDIIALTTSINSLDVSHMGFIAIVNGEPHLMHASMKEMKVIIDPLPIHKYLSGKSKLTGIRVIRLNE